MTRSLAPVPPAPALGLGLVLAIAALAALSPVAPAHAQGTLSALQTDVDQIARRARPAVVTVMAQRPGKGGGERRLHTRVGSGVAVEESSVLTTASVVLGAERVLVRTANGLTAEAELAGVDPVFNLALLRVPSVRLPVIRLAAPHTTEVGDWVISLGTSYGAQPTQSVGNIAYRHREPYQTLLQLTNTVYPGNSGAAALNTRGELIGIVQGELGSPEPAERDPESERRPSAISFALPIETIRPVFESLRREGRVRHGFLGVTTKAASVGGGREGGRRTAIGARVENVVSGGPAARAGLRRGDLIVAYEGERVEYPEQLARWVAATPPGTPVEVVYAREDVGHTVRTVLGESPDAMPRWIASDPPATPAPRITELEREIRRLSGELTRLKERRR